MEATSAISAPAAEAGTSNGSDHTPTGNSAGKVQDTESRQVRGAESQTPPAKTPAKAKPAPAATNDDDPEWDFGDGRRAKRSDVVKRLRETQTGAQKAWKERQEYEAKLKARDEKLASWGITSEDWEKDPEAAFERAAQERLARKLEEATRDPRELAAEKAQRERDEALEKLRAHEETQKKEAYKQEVAQHFDKLAGHFATALKDHGLPVHPKTVWQMASLFQAARKSGERISLSELARRTEESINGDLNHYLAEPDADTDEAHFASGEALAKRLGPKRVEALRRYLLKQHQSKFNPQPTQRQEAPKVFTSKGTSHGYVPISDLRAAGKMQ